MIDIKSKLLLEEKAMVDLHQTMNIFYLKHLTLTSYSRKNPIILRKCHDDKLDKRFQEFQ